MKTMPRTPKTIALLAGLTCLLSALARPGLAHGPVPSVLGVVAENAQGLQILRLSNGLAQRRDGRWRYLCPTAWGNPPLAPATSADGWDAWIASAAGMKRLDATGLVSSQGLADLTAATVRDLAVIASQGVVALTGPVGEGRLVRLGPPATELWRAAGTWTSVAVTPEGPVIGGIVNEHLAIAHLDGSVTELPVDASAATVRLHYSGGHLYAVVVAGQQAHVGRVEGGKWTALAKDYMPLYGPVDIAGQLFVVSGGVLRRIGPAGLEPVDDSRWFTCLGQGAGGVHACVRTEVFALEAGGKLGKRLFGLSDLSPPQVTGLKGDDDFACQAEWEDFAREGGLDVAGSPAPAVAADGGCTTGGQGANGQVLAGLALLAAAVVRVRRSIRLASRPGVDLGDH